MEEEPTRPGTRSDAAKSAQGCRRMAYARRPRACGSPSCCLLPRSTCRRSSWPRRCGARASAVSKATVYNTLNLFAGRGLIRQLAVDSTRSCFDSNVEAHYHFHDEATGALTDVGLPEVQFSRLPTRRPAWKWPASTW